MSRNLAERPAPMPCTCKAVVCELQPAAPYMENGHNGGRLGARQLHSVLPSHRQRRRRFGDISAPHEHASIESREKKIHGPKALILAVANCNKTNIFKAPSRPYSSKQTRVKITEMCEGFSSIQPPHRLVIIWGLPPSSHAIPKRRKELQLRRFCEWPHNA